MKKRPSCPRNSEVPLREDCAIERLLVYALSPGGFSGKGAEGRKRPEKEGVIRLTAAKYGGSGAHSIAAEKGTSAPLILPKGRGRRKIDLPDMGRYILSA